MSQATESLQRFSMRRGARQTGFYRQEMYEVARDKLAPSAQTINFTRCAVQAAELRSASPNSPSRSSPLKLRSCPAPPRAFREGPRLCVNFDLALRKLKHPSRSRKLRSFLDN